MEKNTHGQPTCTHLSHSPPSQCHELTHAPRAQAAFSPPESHVEGGGTMSRGPSLCPKTQPRLRLISNLRQGRQTQGLRTGARRAGNSRPNTPRAPPTPPHLLPLTQCLLLSSSPATGAQDQAICEQERRRPTGGHRDFWRQWGGCSEGWGTGAGD